VTVSVTDRPVDSDLIWKREKFNVADRPILTSSIVKRGLLMQENEAEKCVARTLNPCGGSRHFAVQHHWGSAGGSVGGCCCDSSHSILL
jgi:hypothetical protein